MALEVHMVSRMAALFAAEEVIKPNLIQRSRTRKGREVAPDPISVQIGSHHHDRRIPSDIGPDVPLNLGITRKPRLVHLRDGVDVGG
ncbi:unannotated protein [freshwater metagenome]|uniref:Unannotated protein n=1 Tax=freshwater metagenome TaxID=449393 RepID=A0A6J6SR78_9ZZZZ